MDKNRIVSLKKKMEWQTDILCEVYEIIQKLNFPI